MNLKSTTVFFVAITFAIAAKPRPGVVQNIEKAHTEYTEHMQTMAKKCKKETPQESMQCVCSHLEILLRFKTLVEEAAKTHPNESVTFHAKSQTQTVTLGKLAKDFRETKRLETMCQNPNDTAIKLTRMKAAEFEKKARNRLLQLYDLQMSYQQKQKRVYNFKPFGFGLGNCQDEKLDFNFHNCEKDPYKFSISAVRTGDFKIEARTQTGKKHPLFPGCQTPDLWTIDQNRKIKHVKQAAKDC